jgi:CelD/BcsL family acetyltransferase involved in cellulose biosynthesis
MDALVSLHKERWGARSQVFASGRGAFHREFAAVALERGWLRLWLAEAEGRAIAASYGFRFAGVEYGYQAGRDPAWDRAGVGTGLIEHTIREACADGVGEFRMLRGGESYKQAYATDMRNVVTIAASGSSFGRTALAGVTRLAATPRGRRILNRLGR